MKNKSKSCFNFTRRELSESEKLLLNKYKYNEIESEQNETKVKDLKTLKNKNDFTIKEIENRLDNDYSKYSFNNKYNKTNIDNTISIYKNNLYKTSKEIVNKYINPQSKYVNPQSKLLNDIDIDYSKLGKTYNKNNSVVNYNFINLTESLLNKTQNIIFPYKTLESKKTNLKNNSCKNIFCFKRIKGEDNINKENTDIPKLLSNKNIIKDYSFKDFINNERKKLKASEKKYEFNLSDININKKKEYESIFKKRNNNNNNNNNKYLFNKNLSSVNIKVIKPYKYFSTSNNNKKTKNKISKNYSQTDININKNKVSRKINGYNYKFNGSKNSLLNYSSIFSDLIYKNKKYF